MDAVGKYIKYAEFYEGIFNYKNTSNYGITYHRQTWNLRGGRFVRRVTIGIVFPIQQAIKENLRALS